MTNTEIVNCIYRDYDYEIEKYVYQKFRYKQYVDDIKQEVYLKLMILDNNLLYNLYFTTGVLYYIKRIIINILNNEYSIYHKMRLNSKFDTPEKIDEEEVQDERLNIILDVLDEDKFFNRLYYYFLKYKVPLYIIESDLNISKRVLMYQFDLIRKKIKKNYERKRTTIY